MQINKTNSTTNMWKNIVDYRDLFTKGLLWILGNRTYINLWYDNWLDESHLIHKINDNMEKFINKQAKVSDNSLLPGKLEFNQS